MDRPQKTAGVIIIGDEILSGRTQDSNLAYIAKRLDDLGVIVNEARVIPDLKAAITATVRHFSANNDYVFTTGGIGPTHDDITTDSVAEAFGKKVIRHPGAVAAMQRYYKPGELTGARLKMAGIPEEANLIHNPVSAAPGYQLGNVFVLAGVPSIMRGMFASLEDRLIGGVTVLSASISTDIGESRIAAGLGDIQSHCKAVAIGSYPYSRQGQLGVNIVLRSTDKNEVCRRLKEVESLILELGGKILEVTLPD